MVLSTTFRALKYHNYRLYFSGQAISLIGTWMQRMAVSWLVYSITHSAVSLGIVVFAGQFPVLLLSPYAGAFCDRHNRYKILLITQIASLLQAGLLAAMVLSGHTSYIGIIVLSAMLGIINAFDTPSRQSLIIELIDDKKDLPNAIALNSSMVTLARLLGPAAAGVLLSNFGEGICFLINFLSFFAVIISLLFIKIKFTERKENKENIWTGLSNGYSYINTHKGIRSVIFLIACTSFVIMPYSTLLPVFAKNVFNGDVITFSWLNGISGLGALGGALFMATLKPGRNLLKIILYACSIFSVCLLLFSFSKSLALSLVFIMIAEFGMLSQIAATNTYIQTTVDENMRGRVISYYVMAFQGMQPFGSFLAGFLAHHFGASITVTLQAATGILMVIVFLSVFKRTK